MLARMSGSAWEILAPAKLNLYLEVLGRRADGFHELETLMTPVRIFDRLRWIPTPPNSPAAFSLEYDPATPASLLAAAPPDRTNLAWRACEALGRRAGMEPHGRLNLLKRIPVQAGMGGASADAAAAMILANAAWGLDYGRPQLIKLAAEVGSDVPFFFAGGPAICRGRGEQVISADRIPRLHVVVVKPAEGVSTAAAFHKLHAPPARPHAAQDSHRRLAELVDNLRSGRLARAARHMVNRLQDVAAQLCPAIERVREAFVRCGVPGHVMTGSGSAYFGLLPSARQARRVARRLASWNLGTVFATASCRAASPPL
jgi:4-diphosphocytidyl-2-C-methyl-D-erythritol kinase